MQKLKWWLFMAIALLITLFVIQNWEPVSVRLLFWRVELPRVVMVSVLLVIGFLAGLMTGGRHLPDPHRRDKPKHTLDESNG